MLWVVQWDGIVGVSDAKTAQHSRVSYCVDNYSIHDLGERHSSVALSTSKMVVSSVDCIKSEILQTITLMNGYIYITYIHRDKGWRNMEERACGNEPPQGHKRGTLKKPPCQQNLSSGLCRSYSSLLPNRRQNSSKRFIV